MGIGESIRWMIGGGAGSSTSASISVALLCETDGILGDGGVEGSRILDRGAKSPSSLDSSTSSFSTIGTHASASLDTTTGTTTSFSGSSAGYLTAASNRAIIGFEVEAKVVPVRGAVFGVEGRNGPVELAIVKSLGPPTNDSRFVRFDEADLRGSGAEGRGSSPSRSRGFGIVTASLGGRDGGRGEEGGFQVDISEGDVCDDLLMSSGR